MISGPSIVGAIDLWAKVVVRKSTKKEGSLTIRSNIISRAKRTVPFNELAVYDDKSFDNVQAAAKVFFDQGTDFEPIDINVSTGFPIKAGLSSSAAVSLATIEALNKYYRTNFSRLDVCGLAYKVEDNELKTGAGQMDFYSCGLGGLKYLNFDLVAPDIIESFNPPELYVVIVDTLTPRDTKYFIANTRKRFEESDPLIKDYIKKTELTVERLRILFKDSEANIEEIGDHLTKCHTYLRDNIRCSTKLLDECVEICNRNGAYGSKLTGSGLGGCMFALVSKNKLGQVRSALKKLPVQTYIATFTDQGLRV